LSTGEYCRAVESLLCRKNDGHLIRVVGPAFEMVCSWEKIGIPLGIIERAIERRHLRYCADGAGARRRPLRIEFCEDDVLDLFDQWRRAVGISQTVKEPFVGVSAAPESTFERPNSRATLVAHLDEVIARLELWSETPTDVSNDTELSRRVSRIVESVNLFRKSAKGLRGRAREEVITKLKLFDEELMMSIRASADQILTRKLETEARASLEPFRSRMASKAFQDAVTVATDRLLVSHFRLPSLLYD